MSSYQRSLNGPERSWCHETSLREITGITVSLFRCPIFFNASKTFGNFGCFPAAHIQKSGPPAMRQSLARKTAVKAVFPLPIGRSKKRQPLLPGFTRQLAFPPIVSAGKQDSCIGKKKSRPRDRLLWCTSRDSNPGPAD